MRSDQPQTLPPQPGDPVAGIQRIHDSTRGIGFIVFPPYPLMSAFVEVQVIALFLRRTDNGALSKPSMLDLVMN